MVYQEMYLVLFRAITKAIAQLEAANYGQAKELLLHAQQEAEERYLSEADPSQT